MHDEMLRKQSRSISGIFLPLTLQFQDDLSQPAFSPFRLWPNELERH
jgi:hypothetical protein